ncbi:MAG: RNA-binding protein [Dehalococcoidia bacterium]|nr:RNA-binding protein [Dehalococcoidia bacterium]
MRIYVGNLPYDVTEEELRAEFADFGEVTSVMIPKNGRSKGFGFVDMPSHSEAEAAVSAMNGKTLRDRTLVVSEARPRTTGGREERGGGPRRERRY